MFNLKAAIIGMLSLLAPVRKPRGHPTLLTTLRHLGAAGLFFLAILDSSPIPTFALGLAFSLTLIFWLMMVNAWNVYLSYAFLSQSFWSLGAMMNSATVVSTWAVVSSSTTNILIVGALLYVITTAIVLIGLNRYMRSFQRWLNIISFISFAIIIGAVVMLTNQDFIARFNGYMSPLSGTADP